MHVLAQAARTSRDPLGETRDTFARLPGDPSRILVALSGGKDSLCTLDVTVRKYGAERVTPFLMELVKDLDCEWEIIRKVEKRYGVKCLGVPHHDLPRLFRDAVMMPSTAQTRAIKLTKQADTEAYVRKLTGSPDAWTAWGMRAADSVVRRAMLARIKGIDVPKRRIYPIWTWNISDVYGYLRTRKIPTPRIVGGGKFGGGVELAPKTLAWLKKFYPSDYRKIEAVFPFVGAAVFRLERMGIDDLAEVKEKFRRRREAERAAAALAADRVSEVRAEAGPPESAEGRTV